MDPAQETLRAYDLNAVDFAETWWSNRLSRQMSDFRALVRGPVVIDLGCGAGRDVEWLTEQGLQPVGLDLSAGMLAEGRRRLPSARLVRGDLCRLPMATAAVDGAWACSSLVHLSHELARRALREITRVLKPGGALYLGLEGGAGGEWRMEANGARRHYYFWSPEQLVGAMGDAGLVVRDHYIERVGPWSFLTALATRASI
jgi:ubiquinone/menaquinone biosynthesis C-methylase UbiE